MSIYLKKLSTNDGSLYYEMLKRIGVNEHSFTNPVNEMNFEEYRAWLIQQSNWDEGNNLPDGYVGQTIYWLMDDELPVGIGKIRHRLTNETRKNGGNIGYAIDSTLRGKGYGGILLNLLLQEAHSMEIEEVLLTIDKDNLASQKVALENHCVMVGETKDKLFYSI